MKNLIEESEINAYVSMIQMHVTACKNNKGSCKFLLHGFCDCQCNLCINFNKQFRFSQKEYEDHIYLSFNIYCEQHKNNEQFSINCSDCKEIDYEKIKPMLVEQKY